MKLFKIHSTNGISAAPTFFVDAVSEENAIQVARSKSGLGRFESWEFSAWEIIKHAKK